MVCKAFRAARADLNASCVCPEHKKDGSGHRQQSESCCSVRIAETILVMSYLLGRLNLTVPLRPRRRGILAIYDHMRLDQISGDLHSIDPIRQHLMTQQQPGSLGRLFSIYATLFSEEKQSDLYGFEVIDELISAISDGRIYCFVGSVQNLSDRYEQASIIHLGAGSIQLGQCLHYKIHDGDSRVDYPSQIEQLRSEIPTVLTQDTTSPKLQVSAIVGNHFHLSFQYQLTSRLGNILINPAKFVSHSVAGAVTYKEKFFRRGNNCHPRTATEEVSHVNLQPFHGTPRLVAHGDGSTPDVPRKCLLIRPHFRNTLGRCAALATSEGSVAILNSQDDLNHLARVFNNGTNDRSSGSPTWTLIF